MSTESRQVIIGQTIILEIDVLDARGVKVDPDSTPEVAIIDSRDFLIRALSSTDVVRTDVGRYRYSYSVPSSADTGIWIDRWRVVVNGFETKEDLNFIVLTQSADIEVSGDQIGDPARVSYTQDEIIGINILLAMLKARLKNDVKKEALDAYGNIELVDCPIFTNDELVWFLRASLSEFNQTPHFTDFTFAMPVIYDRYAYIIVEGAYILAVAAQMLIEAGREFTITDNGITMQPPPLSTTLNNQLGAFISKHVEQLKHIKWSIKPQPIGFGSFRVLANNPNFLRLRHLRQRRII
jgi:hypothetical protein